MTLAHTERIHVDMAPSDPEFRFTGDALDELLKGFPEDFGAAAPTEDEAADKTDQNDAVLAGLQDRVFANSSLGDVGDVDKSRRFTFTDLDRRLPFDGFSFNTGVVVLSDNILTTRERDRRIAKALEAKREGEPYEENLGTQYAREQLDLRLSEHGFTEHARHIAKLALTELCSNTSIHGEGIDGIAGRCEAQYFPEMGKLVVTAVNVSNRPKQRKEDDTRGVQEKGRGLYTLAGFLREEGGEIGDNMGRFRYSDTIVERYTTSPSAEVAGIGRTATFAVIDKELLDNSKNDPSVMESPNPQAQKSSEEPTDEA